MTTLSRYKPFSSASTECARECFDLGRNLARTARRAPGAAVPIARIARVSFHEVHDGMCPASLRRGVRLYERMSSLPIAIGEVGDRVFECGHDRLPAFENCHRTPLAGFR